MTSMALSQRFCERIVLALVLISATRLHAEATGPLKLTLRSRGESADSPEHFQVVDQAAEWSPEETAVIVCDMWDKHWCPDATDRVGEMAPRMNRLISSLRTQGVLIVHCPSDTIDYYKDHPARQRVLAAPKADVPQGPDRKEGPFPIEAVAGGCTSEPAPHEHRVWNRQIEVLDIKERDAITDRGDEVLNLFHQRGIRNLLVMGVHTNMCILNRPFGIKAMVRHGLNVALVRDMTDTMYNSQGRPYVDHFSGTDLMVEWLEKYWCSSVTSDQVLGGEPFQFEGRSKPRLLIVAAEDEYKTERTLPAFSRKHLNEIFRVSFVFGDAADRNNLSGIEALNAADLAIFSVRRRTPRREQMEVIRRFLKAGKPLVAIRTTSHAFASFPGQAVPVGHDAWVEFDREVLGCHYEGHYGNKDTTAPRTIIWAANNATDHAILAGVRSDERPVTSWLYKSHELSNQAKVLLWGRVGDQPTNEPVAWTNRSAWGGGKVFYTMLGNEDDFASDDFQKLLLNAVCWAAESTARLDSPGNTKTK